MDGDLDKLTVALSALPKNSPLREGACNQNSQKSGTEGWSLLHVAAEEVCAVVCNALVDQWLLLQRNAQMCEVLISGCADPNAKAADGQTALHIAAYHYDAQVRLAVECCAEQSVAGGAGTAPKHQISKDCQ